MPTRLLFDLGGTVAANGTATVGGGAGQQQPASSWSLAILTASLASGSGAWTVELVRSQGATGTLLGATFGDTIQSGPYLLAPGEMLQASVAGATAGVGIIGSVYGTQGLSPNNLPPISAVPSASESVNASVTGPLGTYGPSVNLGTVSVNPTGVSQAFSQDFTLPTSFQPQSMTLLCSGNWAPSAGGGYIYVFGATTGFQYAFLYPPNSTGPGTTDANYVNISEQADKSINIQGEGPAAGTGLSITVIASSELLLSEVDLTSINGAILSRGQDIGANGTSSVPVVPAAYYSPAPWQAPFSLYSNFATWPVGDTTILDAPTSPNFLRIFWYSLSITTSGGPVFITSLSPGPGQISPSLGAAGSVQGDASGLSMGVGAALSLGNAGSSSINASVIVAYTDTNY